MQIVSITFFEREQNDAIQKCKTFDFDSKENFLLNVSEKECFFILQTVYLAEIYSKYFKVWIGDKSPINCLVTPKQSQNKKLTSIFFQYLISGLKCFKFSTLEIQFGRACLFEIVFLVLKLYLHVCRNF